MKDGKFKRTVGIPRELFEILVETLRPSYEERRKLGGRKPNLNIEDTLLMTLTYYRDYPTFFKLGMMFNLDESNVYRWIKWCDNKLEEVLSGVIDIRDLDENSEQLVDVTECTIQRPKVYDIQKEYYSGKKKKHTIKIQLIMNEKNKKIVSVCFDKGSVHDFSIFKNTTKELPDTLKFLADSGYQGILDYFKNSMTPKKKSKNNPLTDEDKELNTLISSIRITVEHVNSQLKIFRILSERYRSRINTFYSRFLIICSFYNLCLDTQFRKKSINDLDKLTINQLISIIDVYTVINDGYDMVIIETATGDKDDRFVNIDEISNKLKEKTGSIIK